MLDRLNSLQHIGTLLRNERSASHGRFEFNNDGELIYFENLSDEQGDKSAGVAFSTVFEAGWHERVRQTAAIALAGHRPDFYYLDPERPQPNWHFIQGHPFPAAVEIAHINVDDLTINLYPVMDSHDRIDGGLISVQWGQRDADGPKLGHLVLDRLLDEATPEVRTYKAFIMSDLVPEIEQAVLV